MRWKLPTVATLIVVLLLAAGGALIGLVIRGSVGAAVGAAVIALGGVVAGYVPGFRDRAERQRAERKRAEAEREAAQAGLKAVSEPAVDQSVSGPSLLLRPEFAVVDFVGRSAELAALRAWCELDSPRGVRVLTGVGGVGKTRLALKVAEEWELGGRAAVVVASGKESEALTRARGVSSGPVLLVVDYAETRAGLGHLLQVVLDDPGPVRVLLVARSLGEWWDRLAEESPLAVTQLLFQADAMALEAPIDDIPDADLAASALPYFAAKLAVAPPTSVVFELPPQRVPVLVLHTAALVAVLRSMTSPPGPLQVAVTEGVLGELLTHEARYWRRAARFRGLTGEGQVLKAAIAAAILLGARDLGEAAAVAGRVPDLAGIPRGELRRWARWLYGLYPGESDDRLGLVQPDLLAEHHVMTQFAADPALADAIMRDLTVDQADQALTVLARAWTLQDGAARVIDTALRADLTGLAIPAANVAVQTSARVGVLLAAALSDASATLEDLIKIEQALPYPSVAVASAHLATAQRIRRELSRGTDKAIIAQWANRCGVLLSQVGRPAEARQLIEEAVGIYRELAAAMPDRYRPDLASSLASLGATLPDLGRLGDALPATQEALGIYRELAAAMPDRYHPDLASSLVSLGVRFSQLGRPADPLPPAQEAVKIYQELAAAMPDRYGPDLADALTDLSIILWELGRPADALPPTQEAVSTYRELAAAMPDRYRPDLARSLNNLGIWFFELARPVDALPPALEAVSTYREMAAAMPDRYRSDLAASLTNLGVRFAELGRAADALPPTQEAVAIYRDLAQSLTNLGELFCRAHRPTVALLPADEAVAIYRELAAAIPDRYCPGLAASLESLGMTFSELGRPVDALPPAQEAAAIRRQLAVTMPERYGPDLAQSLTNLCDILVALGRGTEAASLRTEVLGLGQ